MKKNKKKKTNILLYTVLFLFILVISLGFVFIKISLSPISDIKNEKVVTIENNWYGKDVLNYLEDENIIRNSTVAYYYAKIKGIGLDFKAGTYNIDTSLSFKDLVTYLSNGNNAIGETVTIKFKEGSRVKDFAKEISDNTNLEYDDLISYWNDENFVRGLMNDYPFLSDEIFNEDVKYYLEGYLFPDTYEFYVNTNIEEVTRKILNKTLLIYNEYLDLINDSSYSIHELFSLASIVQRESGNKEDMRNIAGVFYNRLNDGMLLQSSVTVCYALDIGLNEDWTKCEITQDKRDPYNTYQYEGLPPGPICCFGEDALLAVLNPEENDYYYFIGDVCGDGGTIFARTYAEQLANQKEYLSCY